MVVTHILLKDAKELHLDLQDVAVMKHAGRDSIDGNELLFTRCYCGRGYGGNPYVIGGCQDINECEDPNMCSGTCVNKQGSYDCVNGRKTAKFILIGVGAGLGALFLGLSAT
ncbi:hypothetical protein NL676_013522 [Syzygium grande]|nr:hypothetical protein NL676_013522 [Syzygium grande]